MSFIYDDPKLINDLIKHALDFENKFLKKGQAGFDPGFLEPAKNLRELIGNLEKQIAPGAEPVISHEGDPSVQIPFRSENVESLGALVSFLATNKLTVNGQRIAYHLNEDPKNENYQLYQLEPNAGLLEVEDRSKVTQGFFANKDLLSAYLVSLQAEEAKKPNDVLRVQLSKLIQEANRLLDTKINEQYKAPGAPGQATTPGQQQAGQQAGQQANTNNAIQQMASIDVFNTEYIDFAPMRQFLQLYSTINSEQVVKSQSFEAERAMQMASANTASNTDHFPLVHASIEEMSDIAAEPKAQKAYALVQALKNTVKAVGIVYSKFYQEYGYMIKTSKDPKIASFFDHIDSQIMGTGSAYQSNVDDLNDVAKFGPQHANPYMTRK
jgi:hypothetical protein